MIGLMLDSARTLESRDYYLKAIEFMEHRGCDTLLWHFTDDQGCSLRFDALPESASPNAYLKPELRYLISDAQRRGIDVIPELETLGHTRYLTNARADLAELKENNEEYTSLCPLHPKTRALVAELLDEVCELFKSEFVHVGLDEVNFGGHPLTAEALKTRSSGEVFADYVIFLHRELAARGRRMIMWSDKLLHDPSVAELLPKDIVIANWQYTPKVPDETTRRLQDWGFEVISCPALITHDQTLYPGDQFAVPNLRDTADHSERFNTLGTITTIWTPQRYLHDALWPAVHLAVEFMTRGASLDVVESSQRFAIDFYGLAPEFATVWSKAMADVYELSPMRKPWVAAMKLEMDDRLDGVDVAEQSRRWASIAGMLVDLRSEVTSEHLSFDSLILMCEVAAHVWERAVLVGKNKANDQTLARSVSLGDMLDEAWDRERFADDPRKREPVFRFDADNHLLIAFEAGTSELRRHLDPSAGLIDGPNPSPGTWSVDR